jgi:hypothetical protein
MDEINENYALGADPNPGLDQPGPLQAREQKVTVAELSSLAHLEF